MKGFGENVLKGGVQLKKIRLKLILLTLVCYFIFIAAVTNFKAGGKIFQSDSILNYVSKSETIIYKAKYNSGMDPTPIPRFSPDFDKDMDLTD